MRREDAVPDELEIVSEDSLSKQNASNSSEPPLSPVETPVPLMVVEKVDPASPSYGEVPGTAAYEQRQADAAPDVVLKALDSTKVPPSISPSHSAKAVSPGSIPETIVTQADSIPRLGEESGPATEVSHSNDIMPSVQEHGQPGAGKP